MARGQSSCFHHLDQSIEDDMLQRMLDYEFPASASDAPMLDEFDSQLKISESLHHRRRWCRLGKSFWGAVAAAFKHAVSSSLVSQCHSKEQCRKAVWSAVLRSLTQRYPGSQLPEKLVCTLRKHYESMPLSYAQSGFDIGEVFHHVRLLEQVSNEANRELALFVQEHSCEYERSSDASDLSSTSICTSICSEDDELGCLEQFKVVFACRLTVSKAAVTWAMESAGVAMTKQVLVFDKKGLTLVVTIILCTRELSRPERMECSVKAALKRSKFSKLTSALCGSLASPSDLDYSGQYYLKSSNDIVEMPVDDFQPAMPSCLVFGSPSPGSLHRVITDDEQNIVSGRGRLERCLLNSEKLVLGDLIHVGSSGVIYKAEYRGKTVAVKKLRGCETGSVIDVELRADVLCLISCKHKNLVALQGISVDSRNGMCLVMKYMENGSLFDLIQRKGKLQLADAMRLGLDIAEGMQFLHERGIVHRDLNSSSILLDESGRAVIGDMGVVNYDKEGGWGRCKVGGYGWMAPEVLRSYDKEVNMMSNVYSFGMIVWEMLEGIKQPYEGYNSVEDDAMVGVVAGGLKPRMPQDYPSHLRMLLHRCWLSSPLDRPSFCEVIELLHLANLQLLLHRPPS